MTPKPSKVVPSPRNTGRLKFIRTVNPKGLPLEINLAIVSHKVFFGLPDVMDIFVSFKEDLSQKCFLPAASK